MLNFQKLGGCSDHNTEVREAAKGLDPVAVVEVVNKIWYLSWVK